MKSSLHCPSGGAGEGGDRGGGKGAASISRSGPSITGPPQSTQPSAPGGAIAAFAASKYVFMRSYVSARMVSSFPETLLFVPEGS